MKRRVAVALILVFVLVGKDVRQDRIVPLALKLECLESGRLFRFTISNTRDVATYVLVGQRRDQSWRTQLALLVRWSPEVRAEIYSSATSPPGRTTGEFVRIIDDTAILLAPTTSYAIELNADLFRSVELGPIGTGPVQASALLRVFPMDYGTSGIVDPWQYKPWVGELISDPIRIPADCSAARR